MALNRTLPLQPSSLSKRKTTRNFVWIIPKIPFSNLRIPSLAPPSSTNRCLQLRCSVDQKDPQQYSNNTQVAYPKPTEIPWSKELSNTVNLIGIVGTPIEIKHLPTGKALAWTRLAVKKSASLTSWINMTFWDELAHISFQHVGKGHQIYVLGRLITDIVESQDGKQQIYYKVIVQQLNFVVRSLSSSSPLYDHDSDSMMTGKKLGNIAASNVGSVEELWQPFFANPVDWWDNRKNKKNPKYPDFKHKILEKLCGLKAGTIRHE